MAEEAAVVVHRPNGELPGADDRVDSVLVDSVLVDSVLVDSVLVDSVLVEEVSIDGMCGVY